MRSSNFPQEVAKGVYQFKIPLTPEFMGHVFIYYLKGENGDTLIDAGINSETGKKVFAEQIHLAGGELTKIKQVLLTHYHPDHVGLVENIKSKTETSIWLHPKDAEILVWRGKDLQNAVVKLMRWAKQNGFYLDIYLAQAISTSFNNTFFAYFQSHNGTDLLREKEILAGDYHLQVLSTPGHTPGHVCFYEASLKLLFSGDLVLPTINPVISLEYFKEDENPMKDYLLSLERIQLLPAKLVLPGHEYAFSNLAARAAQMISHQRNRSTQIMTALDGETYTTFELACRIPWKNDSFSCLNSYEQFLSMQEMGAHLQMLCAEQCVTYETHNDTRYYRRN